MSDNLYGNIRIGDYSYDLPQSKIARYPLDIRDRSRLLLWDGSAISDRRFSELPLLADRDAPMVFNNTRVIRARLLFTKDSGAVIEIFCLEPLHPDEFSVNLASSGPVRWKCLIGNQKRWKHGVLVLPFFHAGSKVLLTAERVGSDGEASIVSFSWDAPGIFFAGVLEALGHMPIPPYLGRDDEAGDTTSYQTTYAAVDGSVAAPTAGLHFTPEVLTDLDNAGILRDEITLHVSAGTFRPVKSELICDHMMHAEHFYVTRATIERLAERKVTAVGTTTVRALESLYWLGVRCIAGNWSGGGVPLVSQWEPYDRVHEPVVREAMAALLRVMDSSGRETLEARTEMIIVPGYRFRMVSSMITNFHQPRSTLLLLVAAFAGESWREIYSHALAEGYRFLSYGDSMLLMPAGRQKG